MTEKSLHMKEYLDKRIQKDIVVSYDLCTKGLINVIYILFQDLEKLLVKEDRHFGIVISYFQDIYSSFANLRPQFDDADLEIYNKIAYLYKPYIISAYRKLCRGRLSKADSVIVVIKTIIAILQDRDDTPEEIKILEQVINNFYNNIKNKNKQISLKEFVEVITNYLEEGNIGIYQLDNCDSMILAEEEKNIKKPLEDDGIRFEEDNKLSEVQWTSEEKL